jgi:hypothetical protein
VLDILKTKKYKKSLLLKHHVTRRMEGVVIKIITSVILDGGERTASRSDRFEPEEGTSFIYCVFAGANVVVVAKRNIPVLDGN